MMARMLAAAILLSGLLPAQRVPVIVELFTSEGCSSCPPADAVLSRLDREQPVFEAEVIPLSEHVDYWNDVGWRDRFSSPLFTSRQQDYGQIFRLDTVYTPQMVVNGQATVLGSDWNSANQAVRAAAKSPRAEVKISVRHDGAAFEINRLPQVVRTADILLAITESGLENDVAGGENTGRRLRHTGVVRSLTRLGTLDAAKNGAYSGEARLNLRPEWVRHNLKLVLFVQDRKSRQIVGATSARVF
jgi:hypothetical protein